MDKRFFQWLGFGFAVVALLAISLGLMNVIASTFPPDKKGDLATWVGAIGTVGALIGTIWIASDGERRRRQERLAIAQVTAAAMTDRLTHAIKQVENADRWIVDRIALQSDLNRDWVNNICSLTIDELDSISMWSTDELAKIVALPNRCGAHLAGATHRVLIIKQELMKVWTDRSLQHAAALRFFTETRENLEAARISFAIGRQECLKLLTDINGDLDVHFRAAAGQDSNISGDHLR